MFVVGSEYDWELWEEATGRRDKIRFGFIFVLVIVFFVFFVFFVFVFLLFSFVFFCVVIVFFFCFQKNSFYLHCLTFPPSLNSEKETFVKILWIALVFLEQIYLTDELQNRINDNNYKRENENSVFWGGIEGAITWDYFSI